MRGAKFDSEIGRGWGGGSYVIRMVCSEQQELAATGCCPVQSPCTCCVPYVTQEGACTRASSRPS